MAHTSDRLLAGLKRRGIVPTYQALLTDADVFAMADDVIETYITPLLLSLREDFFTVVEETQVLSGVREYGIPYRAIGRSLREIKIRGSYGISESVSFTAPSTVTLQGHGLLANTVIQFQDVQITAGISLNTPYYVVYPTEDTFQISTVPSGSAVTFVGDGYGVMNRTYTTDTGAKRRLTRINIGDEHYFRSSVVPQGFYMRGDKIALVPTPMTTGLILELWYHLKPSWIVATSEAAQVLSIAGDTVTCVSVPSALTPGVNVDFVQGIQGNSILDMDVSISSVSGNQVVFAAGQVPPGLVVGDWISLAQTSPVLQTPDEVYGLLETHLTKRILKALGDFEGAQTLDQEISAEEKNARMIMEPRVEGEPKKIINRASLLRGVRSRFRYGFLWGR